MTDEQRLRQAADMMEADARLRHSIRKKARGEEELRLLREAAEERMRMAEFLRIVARRYRASYNPSYDRGMEQALKHLKQISPGGPW